jgi:hypothetical protein
VISVSATNYPGVRGPGSLLLLQPIPPTLPAAARQPDLVVGCVHAAIRFACKQKVKLQL